MNANEIKAAWNAFKKEAAKELPFSLVGSCYMNKKQLENGTATITLCNNIEYENEIKYHRRAIEQVNGYESWTAEEKKHNEEHNLEYIRSFEVLRAAYGNRANEAKVKAAEILESRAFKKLAAAIGINHYEVELVPKWEGLALYQIRVHY